MAEVSSVSVAPFAPVNFGFDDLKAKMTRFTVRFDKWAQVQRERVLRERNEFAKTITENRENQKELNKQIDSHKARQAEIAQAMEKERLEAAEAERSINEFSRKKEMLMEHRQTLLKQIEETREAIQKKREQRSQERRALAAQASRNVPELAFWEEHLAMKIEGVREDVLRVVFSHIKENDWTREYSFIIDLAERDYKILECKPALPDLNAIVDRLNESREFFDFLKCMRKAFKRHSLK